MRCIIDIEANGVKPTEIWVIVCKDIDTGKLYIFREVTKDVTARQAFTEFANGVRLWVGHNILGYDIPVINRLLGPILPTGFPAVFDTLIVSKLNDYSRKGGHSLESYGEELGLEKIVFSEWSQYSQAMEDYCVRDVEVSLLVFNRFSRFYSSDIWRPALQLEHDFQLICNELEDTGFSFNVEKARKLLTKVVGELAELDEHINTAFPPREVLIREFTPRPTKFGTINKTSVPRSLWDRIHEYEIGGTYQYTRTEPFNPSSHKQLIDILTEAGWRPVNKTSTHIDTEREINLLKRQRYKDKDVDKQLALLYIKLEELQKYGWSIDEDNLATLPTDAPLAARSLAKRILLESRRRTLTEWLALVGPDARIHGRFFGIGAWTHRMSHRNPNTANIPREFKEDGTVKLLGKELRQLWRAPPKKLLVGVDAEGIQLRVFAHYINDPEFTDALVKGRKDDKSDPHSLNQRVLGNICKTRQAAKRFVYALLLGGGINKLAEILGSSRAEATEALDRLLVKYTGFARMREEVFPTNARKGYFVGLDGRKVRLPGSTQRDREHLAMSGYLQNGEAILIKKAALIAREQIWADPELASWQYVDIVHDELQSECKNDMRIAIKIAEIKANAIKAAGEYYKLRCPMAGSYYNEDIKDYTIGTDWFQTH
jgi:DNA polymerase-1